MKSFAYVSASPIGVRTWRVRVAGLGMAVAVAICGAMAPAHAAEDEKRGGTIRYGHYQEPGCLYAGWVQAGYIQRQYADNLVARAHDGRIVPWLATDWSISEDNLTYVFKIKPGVAFHDGTVLDAKAIVYNFDRWLSNDPDKVNRNGKLYIGEYIRSVTASEPLTLKIELSRPYQPFLTVLSTYFFGILSPTALELGPQALCEKPVGSGPFYVEAWNRGQNVILKRNPNYNSAPATAKHQGPAYVDGIVWKFLKDNTVRYGSLANGESDAIYDIPAVDWGEAQKRFTVIQDITGGTPTRLQLNTARPPFDDVRVRRAFAQVSERGKAVEVAFHGSIPFNGNGALSISTPEHLKELANSYPYDPDAANRLLDEAGWTERTRDGVRTKDGKRLTVRLLYAGGSLISSDGIVVLQILQDQARGAGFDVVLKPIPQADWFAGKGRGIEDYEAQPAYWVASSAEILKISWRPDQDGVVNANNASRFQPPELWKLVEQADRTFDDKTRLPLYEAAQRIIVDNAAVVGLFPLTVSIASQPKLKDVWISSPVSEPVFHDAHFEK
ncbi:ABC transporter substrate-binding protein [Bradyrhizobium sp. SSUT18]|uniref:ABC transporter substrate-binding protein n=1 Tax=Bradyrhizobium sp. SSUT18 TaxID=3040602 RepID=UPI00244D2598|nr:ABC transporter substrate-binding protein [Bradyrhizobium sp. SSUT18]MDH2399888.1 ABC transporter substrate-binding protein [Bradyrhizobium sp. SSUT18]